MLKRLNIYRGLCGRMLEEERREGRREGRRGEFVRYRG